MKYIKISLFLMFTFLFVSISAQNNNDYTNRLAGLEEQLKLAKKDCSNVVGEVYSPTFLKTMTRIKNLKIHLLEKANDPLLSTMFLSCSLSVLAAKEEMEKIKINKNILDVHTKRESLIKEINSIQENLFMQEKFKSSGLAASLDMANKKAQNLEAEKGVLEWDLNAQKKETEDLQKTTEDLQKTTENLQGSLEQEKEKAQRLLKAQAKRRLDVEKRFMALQSSVINVKKDARGMIISMSDILFQIDSFTVKGDLKISLAKIAGILSVIKDSKVLIEGHTDNIGGSKYNKKLSQKRANSVLGYLVVQGVAKPRLKAIGYGKSKPAFSNKTKVGRSKNRRVDLIVMDKKAKSKSKKKYTKKVSKKRKKSKKRK